MRIIDADALHDEAFEAVRRGDLEYEEYDAIINYLDGAPTLAISCGECSFSRPATAIVLTGENPPVLVCENRYSPCRGRNVTTDDFCPHGEKQEDADDE